MQEYRIDFDSIPWETPAAGVRCKAVEKAGRRLRLVEFTNEFVEPDWCCNGHIGMILEGQMEIDFDEQAIIFGPGDGVFIPPGEEHKHKGRVLGDVVRAILVEET